MRGKPECLSVRVLSVGHHGPGARADWIGSAVLEEGGLAIRGRLVRGRPSCASQFVYTTRLARATKEERWTGCAVDDRYPQQKR